jgi:hypothetical protein
VLIGELISRFGDERVAAEVISKLDDSDLAARVSEAAANVELTNGEFASSTVQHFVTHASELEWIAVFGQLSESEDPPQTFLRHVLLAALQPRPVKRAESHIVEADVPS